ncbi:MAG: terminase small subunit [Myxococcales bacterium]|nr:terminase small subunit [Myxococcales bacterium]
MKEVESPGKLTAKQEAFCREYMIDFNGAAAARRAGYSERTANRIAHENLSKPDIQYFLSGMLHDAGERAKVTVDDVVAGLRREAENPENSGSARVAAWVHLGKYIGLFRVAPETVTPENEFASYTDEELNECLRTGKRPARFRAMLATSDH